MTSIDDLDFHDDSDAPREAGDDDGRTLVRWTARTGRAMTYAHHNTVPRERSPESSSSPVTAEAVASWHPTARVPRLDQALLIAGTASDVPDEELAALVAAVAAPEAATPEPIAEETTAVVDATATSPAALALPVWPSPRAPSLPSPALLPAFPPWSDGEDSPDAADAYLAPTVHAPPSIRHARRRLRRVLLAVAVVTLGLGAGIEIGGELGYRIDVDRAADVLPW